MAPPDLDNRGPGRTWPLLLGLLAITAAAALQRWPGVSPNSLWLDDQWVASLVKHAALGELPGLHPPAPIGFIVSLKLMTAVFGFESWALQIIPLLAGIAQLPLIGWIAFRMTGRASLGCFAALLLLGSRSMAVYSLRVKQFTLEGVITLILIGLLLLALRRMRPSTLIATLAVAVVAPLWSFTALPVGMVVVAGLAIHLLASPTEQRAVSRPVGACLLCLAVLAIEAALMRTIHSNDRMNLFWVDSYMPLNDLAGTWAFLTTNVLRFVTGAMCPELRWLGVGVPLGILLLLARSRTRSAGWCLLLFFGGMLVASALHAYPLGGRRTDIFSYPITVLTITAAVWMLTRRAPWLDFVALLVVLIPTVLLYPRPRVHYPPHGGRMVVELANERVEPGDALIVGPNSSWALGCYGRWPVRLVPTAASTNGFIADLDRPGTLVLSEMSGEDDFRAERSVVEDQIRLFIQSVGPDRVVVLTIGYWLNPDQWIAETVEGLGYKPLVRELHPTAADGGTLIEFRKANETRPQQRQGQGQGQDHN